MTSHLLTVTFVCFYFSKWWFFQYSLFNYYQMILSYNFTVRILFLCLYNKMDFVLKFVHTVLIIFFLYCSFECLIYFHKPWHAHNVNQVDIKFCFVWPLMLLLFISSILIFGYTIIFINFILRIIFICFFTAYYCF